MDKPRIVALIPAYNEEERIVSTIRALKGIPEFTELLVVDDGSTDNTSFLANQAGAKVLRTPVNLGKGGAVNYGLQNIEADIVAFLDADLGESACEAKKLLLPVLEGKADMSIAQFPPAKRKGGIGLVKGLAKWGIKHFANFDANSPLSGQRVLTWELIEYLGKKMESGYGIEVGLTIDAIRGGFRVIEVPVQMYHSETGRDLAGFLHRGKQFFHVVNVLLRRVYQAK